MIQFVYGGSACGKSEFAEQLLCRLAEPRIYLATMQVYDDDGAARVRCHRQRRAAMGFETLECCGALTGLEIPEGSAVLLECMGNLVANLLYGRVGDGYDLSVPSDPLLLQERSNRARREARASIDHLCDVASDLVIVGNDVFGDGEPDDPSVAAYLDVLASAQHHAARRADVAYEMVCGIPLRLEEASR